MAIVNNALGVLKKSDGAERIGRGAVSVDQAITEAQDTANAAGNAASQAQDTANAAGNAASQAQDTANAAGDAASQAQQGADTAQATAEARVQKLDGQATRLVYSVPGVATSTTLNLATSHVFRVDASVNRTLSLSNLPTEPAVYTITVDGSAGVITWPIEWPAARWAGGALPELGDNWTDVVALYNGVSWTIRVGASA